MDSTEKMLALSFDKNHIAFAKLLLFKENHRTKGKTLMSDINKILLQQGYIINIQGFVGHPISELDNST